jgi:hypothetical protein
MRSSLAMLPRGRSRRPRSSVSTAPHTTSSTKRPRATTTPSTNRSCATCPRPQLTLPLTPSAPQTFEAHISQFDAGRGIWVPKTDIHDLQLDFTMLDPHVRTALPHDVAEPGTYSLTFRAPDRHGVFKFIVDHKRTGYVSPSLLSHSQIAKTLTARAGIRSSRAALSWPSSRRGMTATHGSSAPPGRTTPAR